MGERSTRYYRRNEAEVMNRLGFKGTVNSGAGWVQKEDGESDCFLCQLKSTDAQSISIKQNDIHVLENHASVSHKCPIFALQFLNTGEVWVMISESEFESYKAFKEQQEKCEETLDNLEEEEYNNNCPEMMLDKSKQKRTHSARIQYMRQMEKEREEREQKQRDKQKEMRREFWKTRNLNNRE